MVFYKPVTDINEISKLFSAIDLDDTQIYGAYIALEQAENYEGKCLVKINGMYCEISNIETVADDKLLVEGLLRAALNFAGNRNAYIARCSNEKIKDTLELLGFYKKDDFYEGDIPTLLLGSCCKH